MEQWRVVAEAPKYEISNLGRLRRDDHILARRFLPNGYETASLYVKGKRKYTYIHRLVAIAFIPNLQNKRCVNHIDCDKGNNIVSNLEWCTYAENNNHPPTLKSMRMSMKKRFENASGCVETKYNTFATDIRVGRKLRPYLGTFKTKEEACAVFSQARAIRNTLAEILPDEGIVQIIQFANLSKSK